MKSELKIFENEKFGKVRTMVIQDEPWFVGKDVAAALGYGDGNNQSKALTNAIKDHVDDEDKHLMSYDEFKGYQNGDLKGISHYGAFVINESGVYALIFGSKLPAAQEFKHWVTSEVLPTIRKTGGYVNNEDQFVNTYLSHLDPHSKQLFHLTLEALKDANRQIKELKPNAEYCCKVLSAPGTLTMTQIATEYGKSAQEMNRILHELKVQRKVNHQWVLYRKYSDKGYTKDHTYTKERDGVVNTYVNTQWTQKGRRFLYDLLKDHGVIPVSEQVA